MTHVYQEKSSTITNAYDLPPRFVVLEGPNKSIWRSSRGLNIEMKFLFLKDVFICFPI